MFPVQTNRIFLTPLKARKGDTLDKAVQVTRFRLLAGFACGLGATAEAALAHYLLDRYDEGRRASPDLADFPTKS